MSGDDKTAPVMQAPMKWCAFTVSLNQEDRLKGATPEPLGGADRPARLGALLDARRDRSDRKPIVGYAPADRPFSDARWGLAFAHDVLEHNYDEDDGSAGYELQAQGVGFWLRRAALASEVQNLLGAYAREVTKNLDLVVGYGELRHSPELRALVAEWQVKPPLEPQRVDPLVVATLGCSDEWQTLKPFLREETTAAVMQWLSKGYHDAPGIYQGLQNSLDGSSSASAACALLYHFATQTGYGFSVEQERGRYNSSHVPTSDFGWPLGTRIQAEVPLILPLRVKFTISLAPERAPVVVWATCPPVLPLEVHDVVSRRASRFAVVGESGDAGFVRALMKLRDLPLVEVADLGEPFGM